jgi:hypothetical protein
MSALSRARSLGIGVRFADLGDWGPHELRSEYDPSVPEIRLNIRIAAALGPRELGEYVALAVGHELYHHLERIGEIAPLRNRGARESAASKFAREIVESAS